MTTQNNVYFSAEAVFNTLSAQELLKAKMIFELLEGSNWLTDCQGLTREQMSALGYKYDDNWFVDKKEIHTEQEILDILTAYMNEALAIEIIEEDEIDAFFARLDNVAKNVLSGAYDKDPKEKKGAIDAVKESLAVPEIMLELLEDDKVKREHVKELLKNSLAKKVILFS